MCYRANIMAWKGEFVMLSIDLHCEDDQAAIKLAQQLVDSHDIELWQEYRRIAVFKRPNPGVP